MQEQINSIIKTRESLLKFIENLDENQLNHITKGFNTNIIWNLAHLISAQQGVCYLRADLPLHIDEDYFQLFRPGTKPERFFANDEILRTKSLLLSTMEDLKTDIENQIFGNYQEWITRYGVVLSSIKDAMEFLPYHEGMHAGYIMALKRVIL